MIHEPVVSIPLSRGMVSLVDADDYERVSQYKWSYHALGYAFRGHGPGVPRQYEYLHRFILNNPPTNGQRLVVDHINGDRLDNRKANLRLVNKSINSHNSHKIYSHNKTSGIRGIHWQASVKRWKVAIVFDGKRYQSKHKTLEEAVITLHKIYNSVR